MDDIKMIPTTTCNCGGEYKIKTEAGYISGRDLGRPAGAKGEDIWAQWYECSSCHKTCGELPRIPEPCHVCGSGDNLSQMDMLSVCKSVTGMYEWVPGIDNCINLCDNPACFVALEKKVDKIMSETFFE